MTRRSIFTATLFALTVSGCAANSAPKLPYPAFVQAADLPDMFVAALPGVRAKPLAGDVRTRTSSNLIDLPADWKGSTGGSPGKSVEIYVLAGELKLSEFVLGAGAYAYIPPGSLGFNITTDDGAQVLYFLDDIDASPVIRTPMIMDSALIEWVETSPGRFTKELRSDPGSGARSWLLRIEPGAELLWTSSSVVREGFMVAGQFQDSECFNGEARTWQYTPGGYFLRPPDVLNGGPESAASTATTWFLREQQAGEESTSPVCFYTPPAEDDE